MKKILPILLLAAFATAAYAFFHADEADSGADSTIYGNVDIREVALAFRQSGRLATVAVEEGDAVAAGDAIATLDDLPQRQAVEAAEAQLERARAHLDRLESGSRPQEIAQARSNVSEAEARLEAAAAELERKAGLVASGASSEREVEAARERHDAAEARLAAALQALDLAQEGFRDEDIAAGRAELRLATAELERARTALDDTRLFAPSPGTVSTRAQEPGAIVGAGTPIAILSLHQPVVVRAYVPETRLGRFAPGTAVSLTTDSSATTYRGRVGFVSPRAEFTPKSVETPELRTDLVYRLRIVVEDADSALLQGMPVTVRLDEGAGGGRGSKDGRRRDGQGDER